MKFEELKNKRFGKLTVKMPAATWKTNLIGKDRLVCLCDCGKETTTTISKLLGGHTQSCGCSRRKLPIRMIGKKYNKLTVLEIVEHYYRIPGNNNTSSYKMLCKCDCGNTRLVDYQHLLYSAVKSCGCTVHCNAKTGAAFNRIYSGYKKNAAYKHLEWSLTEGQAKFLLTQNCAWCGVEPYRISEAALENFFYNGIDRVDNDKGYYFDNCQTLCWPCNDAKGKRRNPECEEWLNRIIRKNPNGIKLT